MHFSTGTSAMNKTMRPDGGSKKYKSKNYQQYLNRTTSTIESPITTKGIIKNEFKPSRINRGRTF